MFILHLIFAVNAALLIGLGHPRDYSRLAAVNDTNGTDYIITAVDGDKPLRDSAAYVQMVPVVLVKPGHHRFTLQLRPDDTQQLEVQADVQAGKDYEIVGDKASGVKISPTTP